MLLRILQSVIVSSLHWFYYLPQEERHVHRRLRNSSSTGKICHNWTEKCDSLSTVWGFWYCWNLHKHEDVFWSWLVQLICWLFKIAAFIASMLLGHHSTVPTLSLTVVHTFTVMEHLYPLMHFLLIRIHTPILHLLSCINLGHLKPLATEKEILDHCSILVHFFHGTTIF